jgi:Zn-dependent metalloprotease
MSDVIGVCVRSFHAAEGAEANWKIGEDLFVEPGSALRDMKSPGSAYDNRLLGSDPQVGHMKDYVHTYQDHGGVHINSGIPNKAFTVFAESVPGPMHDIPLQVWRATLAMSGPRTDFGLFARASVVAAGIYGEQARAAWASVGIDA